MEEGVGAQWHRWVSRRAEAEPAARAQAAATLAGQRRSVQWLLRAGGSPLRVAEALPVATAGPRSLWQRVAGSGLRQPLPQVDAAVLALPPRVALFDDAALNHDLYLWWAALACVLPIHQPWAQANAEAVPRALALFPGLAGRVQALQAAEAARRALPWPQPGDDPALTAPVWTWLLPVPAAAAAPLAADAAASPADPAADAAEAARLEGRRRTRQRAAQAGRAPMLLAAKGEALKTFADALALDRGADDSDDGSAAIAAQDIDTLSLVRDAGRASSRLRFDLDLPAASSDDQPVGPGLWLPEWDVRQQRLQPARVLAQALEARQPPPWLPPPALRAQAAQVRRRLDGQRAAPRWQPAQADGDEIDLDGWIRQAADPAAAVRGLYRRRTRQQRDLATLLLADLSLSTDAHANDRQRVIDVIREALYVFGAALSASGDAFAITGFSSVKRQLRLHPVKRFDEAWAAPTLARLGALKPGYYTRMGAALRAGTQALAARPERRKLLLLLTDGKPHDLDGYDGRIGMEDTRQAVLEARRAGLLPFALTIDADAAQVMPLLFGSTGGQRGQGGWAQVRRPDDLPGRLAGLYGALLR